MRAIEVRDPSQVAEARRAATTLARSHGFSEEDAGRVAILVTELATNLIKHGGGGSLLVGSYDDPTGAGIECLALDQGPGMADVAASMRDGHSTAGSPGNGLGAVSRGAHGVGFYSRQGLGTAILARLAQGRPGHSAAQGVPEFGAVSVPVAGEDVCGDIWCRKQSGGGWTVMVADGLGHGPLAAEASSAAARSFMDAGDAPPSEMLATMHSALRPTRGAAVAIAHVSPSEAAIRFAGVGNIAGSLVERDGGMRRMVSNNGTIGHIAKHMRDFRYPIETAAVMILASDGLGTNWRPDAYPGLLDCHPTLIAGVLYRDFGRARDDVTVLVCRLASA